MGENYGGPYGPPFPILLIPTEPHTEIAVGTSANISTASASLTSLDIL